MNERTVWIVRVIGAAVFLAMVWLMLDLHSKLRSMDQDSAETVEEPSSSE